MRRYKSRIRCFYLYRLAPIHLMTEVTSILGLNCKYPNVLTGGNLADVLFAAEKKKSEQN